MQVLELTVLPDADDPECLQAWVDGAVGGDAVRFLLDTGAALCGVPHGPATAGLPVTGTNRGVGAAGVSLGEDEVVVPELRAGGAVLRDVPATRAAPGAMTVPLLGMSALDGSVAAFHLAEGRVVLHDRAPGDVTWCPLADTAVAQPMIRIVVGGVTATACWDTGAGTSVFDTAFAAAHPELFDPVRRATGFDSAGVALDVALARTGAIRAGDAELAPSTCALVDFAPMRAHAPVAFDAVLGLPVMLDHVWWFDLPGGRWAVTSR